MGYAVGVDVDVDVDVDVAVDVDVEQKDEAVRVAPVADAAASGRRLIRIRYHIHHPSFRVEPSSHYPHTIVSPV